MEHQFRRLSTAVLAVTVLLGTAACGQAGLSPTAASRSAGALSAAASHAAASSAAESHAAASSSAAAQTGTSGAPEPDTAAQPQPPAGGQTAVAVLANLPVKGRAPMTGYSRDQFGPAWADVDRNGCDTRNDVLTRDLTGEVYKAGTHNCVVLTGSLADPYTATTIAFVRGDGTSVDIDHVVALGDAWQTGAFGWDVSKRTALANDPLNLLAVDYSANRQKGDADAASWLPGNRGYRCDYVARQIVVKASYGLWVTAAERDAMSRVLATCPNEPVPASGTTTPVLLSQPAPPAATTGARPAVAPAPAPAPAPEPAPAPAPAPEPGVTYANCTAVRAAGAAPIHRGEPGYAPKLDRDGDGIGCE